MLYTSAKSTKPSVGYVMRNCTYLFIYHFYFNILTHKTVICLSRSYLGYRGLNKLFIDLCLYINTK